MADPLAEVERGSWAGRRLGDSTTRGPSTLARGVAAPVAAELGGDLFGEPVLDRRRLGLAAEDQDEVHPGLGEQE